MPSGTTATVSRRPVGRGGPDVAAAGMCIPFRRWYRTISLVHPVCIIYNIRIYIYYIMLYIYIYMTGYGSHANSNGLPSFSLFKLLFVGIPYFQTHGSHCISMIGTVFVQCFSPGLKKNHWCWENSKKGSDSRTLRTFFTIRIPFSNRTTMGIFPCFS